MYMDVLVRLVSESNINGQAPVGQHALTSGRAILLTYSENKLVVLSLEANDPAIPSLVTEEVAQVDLVE
jgi:hypothetical protein